MAGQHLQKLDDDLRIAAKIVSRVPPQRCTTELQSLCLQSYILLAHSAMEHYFESLGRYAATRALERYNREGAITRSLVALVTSKVLDDIGERSRKRIAADVTANIGTFAAESLSLYCVRLDKNHGIKHENLNGIMIPVGVEPGVEDISAYNALNTFGIHRGDIAHAFNAIRIEHTLSNVATNLQTIRAGIATYDAAIETALS